MMMPVMTAAAGAAADRNADRAAAAAEAARQAAAALAARVLDVVALTTASPKHARSSQATGRRRAAALSNVNGKIAEWFC